MRNLESLRQLGTIDLPWQVGRTAMVLDHRPGHTETSRIDLRRLSGPGLAGQLLLLLCCLFEIAGWSRRGWGNQEFREHLIQRGIVRAVKCFAPERLDSLRRPVKQCEMGFGAANISGHNHVRLL